MEQQRQENNPLTLAIIGGVTIIGIVVLVQGLNHILLVESPVDITDEAYPARVSLAANIAGSAGYNNCFVVYARTLRNIDGGFEGYRYDLECDCPSDWGIGCQGDRFTYECTDKRPGIGTPGGVFCRGPNGVSSFGYGGNPWLTVEDDFGLYDLYETDFWDDNDFWAYTS